MNKHFFLTILIVAGQLTLIPTHCKADVNRQKEIGMGRVVCYTAAIGLVALAEWMSYKPTISATQTLQKNSPVKQIGPGCPVGEKGAEGPEGISTPAQNGKFPLKKKFTFNDLAGEIPQDVRELTEFIKSSEKYQKMGARMPRGVLLVGPPGNGKTSIARAIAGETDAYFIATSATEFMQMYVGTGAAYIRKLFDDARATVKSGAYKKALIFIDELDAIGIKRYNVSDSGGNEFRLTLNELLNQLDGFQKDSSIVVIAATNRADDIDEALKRPGRFDRIVKIPLPNKQSREAILKHYAKYITILTVNYSDIAEKTNGFSAAELENLVNEAAIHAVRDNASATEHKHFESALSSRLKKII